jgi:cation:H+ antiporter
MVLFISGIILGFILLAWSADKFVEGASAVAKHLGMPTLMIGIIIVGFGTSAPEMVVSTMAALEGNPSIALGNALGSNIVNIGLILALTAIISPIKVHSRIVRKEFPILLAIVLLFGVMLLNLHLSLIEGLLLILGFFTLIAWSIYTSKHTRDTLLREEIEEEISIRLSFKKAIFWLLIGLVLLVLSSRLVVWGSIGVATLFGISDLIIGLTIIALGTSLPELAASIVAARKNEHDLALGNIIGSNMFNILAVVGIAIAIDPVSEVASEVFYRDWMVMTLVTVLLLGMIYAPKGQEGLLSRANGVVLLLIYTVYTIGLGWMAVSG